MRSSICIERMNKATPFSGNTARTVVRCGSVGTLLEKNNSDVLNFPLVTNDLCGKT